MKPKLNILRKSMFALPLTEANFSKRGFQSGEEGEKRLELVAKVVIAGYNTALETGFTSDLLIHQEMVSRELRGFFTEGIGMGLFTLDLFSITQKSRFWSFVETKGINHKYMSYIGAGIACGVFKRHSIRNFLKKASPTSGLLLLNGIGFYYAYFKLGKAVDNFFIPKNLSQDKFYIECYDNGMGRAFWFINGGNPDKIASMISTFPNDRQGAIWAGIGLAATYAGGVEKSKIQKLTSLAGKHSNRLGEGSVLATHTRDLAGNPHKTDATEIILTGRSAKECQNFAIQVNERLNNQRFIDGKHSLQVFLEEIRQWITENQEVVVN